MYDNKQPKYKSWALWVSISALIVFMVKTIWKVDIGDTVDQFMNVLLPVLIGFGIVNNPNSKDTL